METVSYNELHERQVKLRHIFYPGAYGLVGEAIIAFLALIFFNLSDFSNQLLSNNADASPLSLWSQPLKHLLNKLDSYIGVQQLTLFLLWAVVGALLYILIFRTLQTFFNVRRAVGSGVELVRQDHERGFARWLFSLHDFFAKALIMLIGVLAVAAGSLICFGVASQELRNGLTGSFPANVGAFVLSLLGAMLSVRLIALGLTLSSRHFRNWYLY